MKPDLDLIRTVKGFLSDDEGRHLYQAALEAAPSGPCLEIGSYCGKSTVCIGTACRESGQVLFAIDHHRGSEEQQPGEEYFDPALFDPLSGRIDTFRLFCDTLSRAGLQDTVAPIVCRSELAARAWATPLSFVFIDGGHAFDTVSADYRNWSPHLIPGGLAGLSRCLPRPIQRRPGPLSGLPPGHGFRLFQGTFPHPKPGRAQTKILRHSPGRLSFPQFKKPAGALLWNVLRQARL